MQWYNMSTITSPIEQSWFLKLISCLPFEFDESITMMYPVPGTKPVTVKAARLILVVLATVKCVLESLT